MVSANQFWNSIKARQLGYALIIVPLVTQLSVVLCLVILLVQFEQAIKKERHAKQVITAVDDLNFREELLGVFTGRQIIRNDAARFKQFDRQANDFQQDCQSLANLTREDGTRKRFSDAYREHAQRIIGLYEEGLHSCVAPPRHPIFARFIDSSDYLMEYRWQANRGKEAREAVIAAYRKDVSELEPQAIKDKKNLRLILIGGLLLNALVALYLAASITYQFVARLNQLLRNIKLFSAGQVSLAPVVGDDEIARLDQSFRTIAQEKLHADQQRLLMLNTMSDDIRVPLQTLNATMEQAVSGDYGQLPDEMRLRLKRANSEVLRLLALSADLIDVDRLARQNIRLTMSDSSVRSLVERGINAVQALADAKKITLECRFPEALSMQCDANRIVQVLVNLLSNAIKFSPSGSTVTVTASKSNGKVRISVSDKGPGIGEQETSRVFEKFTQISVSPRAESAGAGLGLYICKALVERHSGNIGVLSKIGDGSTFWIELQKSVKDD